MQCDPIPRETITKRSLAFDRSIETRQMQGPQSAIYHTPHLRREAVSRGQKPGRQALSSPQERFPSILILFSELRLLQRHGTVCPDPPRLSRGSPSNESLLKSRFRDDVPGAAERIQLSSAFSVNASPFSFLSLSATTTHS